VQNCGFIGFLLNPGSGTISLQLNSIYACTFDNQYVGASTTNTIIEIKGNSTGANNQAEITTAFFNHIKSLNNGTCGKHCG